ncbi:hypothetical protein Q3G72_020877 [Acer saccharum]|nr:hypothetical protein Q3G72_020877 [Acer saccharum]
MATKDDIAEVGNISHLQLPTPVRRPLTSTVDGDTNTRWMKIGQVTMVDGGDLVTADSSFGRRWMSRQEGHTILSQLFTGDARVGQPPHHRHELDRCSTTGVRWSPVSTLDGTTVHAQAIQLDRWLLPPPLDGVGFSSAMEREQHPVGSSWIGDAASSWIGGSFYQLHMESGLHLRIFLLKRIVFRLLYKWL